MNNLDDMIDLSSTNNFLKPNVDIDFNNIDKSIISDIEPLHNDISNRYKIKPAQLTLFNTKISAITTLLNYFNNDYCSVYAPLDTRYKKVINESDYMYDSINKFTQINRAVKENSVVIFENPSSIDGIYIALEKYIKAWNNIGCKIIIDETYLEYTNHQSVLKYVNKYENLYIIKSLSEFYNCVGIKSTIVFSNQTNILKLKHTTVEYRANIFEQNYFKYIFQDEVFHKTIKAINMSNLLILTQILKKSKYIKEVYHSDANFILVRLDKITIDTFQGQLKRYNILIKDCLEYDFMDNYYARIRVSSIKNIEYFKKVLDDI
jgi:threonine-phosphate decarboxylase